MTRLNNSMLASIVKANKPQETAFVLRLGPKWQAVRLGFSLMTRRECRTAGVEGKPKSFLVTIVEHGNAANLARTRDRADLTVRRVGGRSIGRTEEAKASGNALDKPTSVWSLFARERVEPS
jgi:hypothetical protein